MKTQELLNMIEEVHKGVQGKKKAHLLELILENEKMKLDFYEIFIPLC